MSQANVNVGTSPGAGNGDSLYNAFSKVNNNFTELYSTITSSGITYANIAPSVDSSASGSGLTLNITKYANIYGVSVNLAGTGYALGESVRVWGNVVGGSYTTHDLIVEVGTLANSSIGSVGTITFTGTPSVPLRTVAGRTGDVVLTTNDIIGLRSTFSSNIDIQNAVDGKIASNIANLIGTAPGVLDTLGEIADALNDDANVYNTLVTTITTANVNLKGYTDDLVTTANVNLKGYTDDLVTTANTNVVGYTDNAVSTANVNLKGYVDAANVNVVGYVDGQITNMVSNAASQSGELASLLANAAVQAGELTSLVANAASQNDQINTANVNLKGYTDNLVTTANVNVVGYVDSAVSTANVNLKGYVDGEIATVTAGHYANSDVKSYLTEFDGSIIPSADVTYNLGNVTHRWNDLYLNSSTIYLGDSTITTVDGAVVTAKGRTVANVLYANSASISTVTLSSPPISASSTYRIAWAYQMLDPAGPGDVGYQDFTPGNYTVAGTTLTLGSTVSLPFDSAGFWYAVELYSDTGAVSSADTVKTSNLSPIDSTITLTGHIIPDADETYDLGSSSYKFGNLYLAGSTIYIGAETITESDVASWATTTDVTTANVNLKGYVDAEITTLNSTITTANTNVVGYVDSAVSTANVNLKGYTDDQFTTGNTNVVGYVDSAVSTANVNLKGYVDNELTSYATTSALTTANTNVVGYVDSAVSTANVNVVGYIDNEISTLIGGAPGTLDTLNEIAAALGDDPNLATTLTNTITSANLNMKGYVDGQVTTLNSTITTANTNMGGYVDNAVSTANVNLKGYVDNELTSYATTSALTTANTNVVGYVDGAVSTANVNLKGYVDNELTSYATTSALTTANVNVVGYIDNAVSTANVNVVGYVDNAVSTANVNVVGYVDNELTSYATTSALTTANVNVVGYVDNAVSTANVNLKGYADANFYTDSDVAAYTGNIQAKVNGYDIGYKIIPQVSAGNVTIALTDSGKHYYSTDANPTTLTIPLNSSVAFDTGTAISIVNQGTGNISVALTGGVSMYLAGNATSASRTITTYGMATLMKVATDTWFINGTGVV